MIYPVRPCKSSDYLDEVSNTLIAYADGFICLKHVQGGFSLLCTAI